jgi:hypothetical protein
MGFHGINRAEINRDIAAKEIIAEVYDEETQQTIEKRFSLSQIETALRWIQDQLEQVSM